MPYRFSSARDPDNLCATMTRRKFEKPTASSPEKPSRVELRPTEGLKIEFEPAGSDPGRTTVIRIIVITVSLAPPPDREWRKLFHERVHNRKSSRRLLSTWSDLQIDRRSIRFRSTTNLQDQVFHLDEVLRLVDEVNCLRFGGAPEARAQSADARKHILEAVEDWLVMRLP